jgi:glutathione S-transferase
MIRLATHSTEIFMLRLLIGNKNYSSWSMRTWVLMRELGIGFEEQLVRFDSFEPDSEFKSALQRIGGAGKVPLLVDQDLVIWDTMAIAEYLHESHAGVWPADARARARARSLCAEMHSGFEALRSHCPLNIEASLAEAGRTIWREQAAVRADVARIEHLWGDALAEHGGPLLFGAFSYADACFAPVCMRLRTYALPLGERARAYVQRVLALASVAAWMEQATAEHDFRPFEEPYRRNAD